MKSLISYTFMTVGGILFLLPLFIWFQTPELPWMQVFLQTWYYWMPGAVILITGDSMKPAKE